MTLFGKFPQVEVVVMPSGGLGRRWRARAKGGGSRGAQGRLAATGKHVRTLPLRNTSRI
jgi:hypothetical protein